MRAYFLWLFKFLTVAIIFFFFVPLLLVAAISAFQGEGPSLQHASKKSVAVIEVGGVIKDSKDVIEELYKQSDNDNVQGLVLRVDSPGGAVGPSQEIYSAVKALKSKKPIVVSMGSVAASGGLYVSLGASKILCQPGTITGSIGVVLQIPNFSKVAEQIGVDFVTIKSGKLKDVGNTFRPMTDEERDFLQSTVSEAYQDFIQAVADSRGLELSKVKEFADGRIILGSQAKNLGLVDAYGGVMDAARLVFELAGEPLKAEELPRLIYPKDKFQKFAEYFESVLGIGKLLSSAPSLQYIM